MKFGVSTDEGDGDGWPAIRARIMDAQILVVATPIWMGQPSSVAKMVLDRLDAEFGEKDEQGRLLAFGKVAAWRWWVTRTTRIAGSATRSTSGYASDAPPPAAPAATSVPAAPTGPTNPATASRTQPATPPLPIRTPEPDRLPHPRHRRPRIQTSPRDSSPVYFVDPHVHADLGDERRRRLCCRSRGSQRAGPLCGRKGRSQPQSWRPVRRCRPGSHPPGRSSCSAGRRGARWKPVNASCSRLSLVRRRPLASCASTCRGPGAADGDNQQRPAAKAAPTSSAGISPPGAVGSGP